MNFWRSAQISWIRAGPSPPGGASGAALTCSARQGGPRTIQGEGCNMILFFLAARLGGLWT
eukprot:8627813-Pyramimonas_sp.AAC.1